MQIALFREPKLILFHIVMNLCNCQLPGSFNWRRFRFLNDYIIKTFILQSHLVQQFLRHMILSLPDPDVSAMKPHA
jgi:hypothetical protein